MDDEEYKKNDNIPSFRNDISSKAPNESIVDEKLLEQHEEDLKGWRELSFNILSFSKCVRRFKVLPMLTLSALKDMDLLRIVNEKKLSLFLNSIRSGYQ